MPEEPNIPQPQAQTPVSQPSARRPSDAEGQKEDFRYIVRLANTDVDGNKSVVYGLTSIKGIGVRVAELVADLAKVSRTEKIGNLKEEETARIESILSDLGEHLPSWAVNRQKDWYTGEFVHLIGTDVDINRRDDVNRMKMIRCYRGVRHEQGQKVRGQRTRSNGRTGLTVGVTKKVIAQQAAAAKKEEEKK